MLPALGFVTRSWIILLLFTSPASSCCEVHTKHSSMALYYVADGNAILCLLPGCDSYSTLMAFSRS